MPFVLALEITRVTDGSIKVNFWKFWGRTFYRPMNLQYTRVQKNPGFFSKSLTPVDFGFYWVYRIFYLNEQLKFVDWFSSSAKLLFSLPVLWII